MRKGWVETSLGEVAEVLDRLRKPISGPEREKRLGEVPYYGATGRTGWINEALFNEELVLLGEDAVDFLNPDVHKAYLIDGPSWVNNHAHVLRPIAEKVSGFFLMESLNAVDYSQFVAFGTRSKLTQGSMLGIKIPIPPLTEQKRIVDVVASVDAYIVALQQQLNHALRAKSALLEKELQKNFSGARKVTLGEVLEISRGGSPRPIQNYLTTEDNGINWIKIGDASSSTKYIYETQQRIKPEGLSKTRRVYPGDFLLSNSMSFGRPYIMRTEGCIHDGWLLLGDVSKHFDEDFLYNFLRSSFIQAQFASLAAGSGVRNLNIEVVSGVEIVLPLVSDQKKIAQFLNSFDEQELALELALGKAMVLRGAILTDLLSGNHEIPASYDSLLGAA